MQKSRARRVGALLVGLAIVGASACGGDDGEAVTTEAPATSEAPASSEAPVTEDAVAEADSAAVACYEEAQTAMPEAPTTEAPTAESVPATEAPASNGELEGMKGTTPKGADISDEWLAKVSAYWVCQGNSALKDFNYAAEAYEIGRAHV